MQFTKDRLGRISLDQFVYFIYKYGRPLSLARCYSLSETYTELVARANVELARYDTDGSGYVFESVGIASLRLGHQ